MKKLLSRIAALVLALLSLSGCGKTPDDPARIKVKVTEEPVSRPATEAEAAALTDFTFKLLSESYSGENLVFSATGIMEALCILGSGAEGEALSQIEDALGVPVEDLSEILANVKSAFGADLYMRAEDESKVYIDSCVTPSKEFMQKSAGQLGTKFYNRDTPGGMSVYVSSVFEVPCLIETLVTNTAFTDVDGNNQKTEYLKGPAVKRSFADEYFLGVEMECYVPEGESAMLIALMPHEGVDMEEALKSLSCESLSAMYENEIFYTHTYRFNERKFRISYFTPNLDGSDGWVLEGAKLPLLEDKDSMELKDVLSSLGVESIFDAQSGGIGGEELELESIMLECSLSTFTDDTKTYRPPKEPVSDPGKVVLSRALSSYVVFDRPFAYFIFDARTKIPLCAGVVCSVE